MYDLGMTSLYLLWNFIVLTVMFNSAVMCNEVFPQLKGESVSILTSEEASVLHPFLQVLIENTEAGYVLFNQKPVCIYGYGEKDLFYYNSPRYKEEIALKEGIRIWKKFSDSSENQPICIHLCKNEDPSIRGWRHILVINKPLFHAVVNENLPLFQLILGPSVTSQKLLDALVIEDQPFHFLLKYNNVLVGKLLGYGTQNSLYVSRLEGIQEAIGESIPPFLQGNSFTRVHREEYLPYPPSFGYKNIQDEFVELDEKIIISSKKLIEENPPYGFGRLKNQESEQVIHKLEETQSLIQKLLKSPFFVEQALEMITQKKFKSMSTSGFKFQFDNTKKVQLLVREIWNSIQSYDLSYCSHFINGLNGASFPMTKMDRKTWDPGYSQEMQKAKENLIHAKAHFCEIESKERFVSIIPKKLYFKINTPGKEKNEIGSLVKLTYSIFSPSGDCLASQSEALINLKNTISGFRLGIKGMKIGETRELWIHPALAYGYDTSLEKCIYLKAIVTLIDTIDSEKTESPSNNEEIDLEFLLDSNIDKTIAESSAAVALRSGTQLRQLLSKDSTLDISKITIDLKEKIDKNKSFQEPSEKDLLNQVLWNLLFTSK